MTVTNVTDIGDASLNEFEEGLAVTLLEMADDENIIGHRLCDWTGVAPTVEKDVSMGNIAQDELGHAETLYEEVASLIGSSLDHLAYQRSAAEFRNVQLAEREFEDWADTVVRQYFYDAADDIRMAALQDGDLPEYDESLAGYLQKVDEEEEFHPEHGEVWLDTLADQADGKEKIQRAIDENWVDALAFFETAPGTVDLAFTGRLIEAEEAAEMDLVNEAVPDDELDDTVAELVETLQSRPTANIGLAKEAIHDNLGQPWRDGLDREARLQSMAYDTPAHEEGVDAFLNGRKSDFD